MRDTPHNHDEGVATGTTRRRVLAGAAAFGAVGLGVVGAPALGQDNSQQAARLTVRIENVSQADTLMTTAEGEASAQPVPLSPGAFAVHTRGEPIFTPGEPERDNGLEEIAEDGMPSKLVEGLRGRGDVRTAGAFTTPVDADGPGPLTPGSAYEFDLTAMPGDRLSFATMFVPSNDLFYAPDEHGLALYEADGDPVTGDVTDWVSLWDAGTEINEEPGVGQHQVQRQSGLGVGLVERGTVAAIDDVNGYEYPDVTDVIRVTIEQRGGGQ